MKHTLQITVLALILSCTSVQATYMTITHVTQGAPTMTTDATDFSWGTLPEWGLGTLIVPGGGVTPGFHVVFFIDPASLLPTALFTFQATDDHFMYFHFAAEGGFFLGIGIRCIFTRSLCYCHG